jgi:signal transduction histidine kinase
MSKQHDEPRVAAGASERRTTSIRRRILGLVLLPSTVLAVLVLVATSYLVFQSFYNRAIAVSVQQVSLPAVDALTSIEEERQLSVSLLTASPQSARSLAEQRSTTDKRLGLMRSRMKSALALAPQEIKSRVSNLTGYLDKLPAIRKQVDARSISADAAFAFYNDTLDSATRLFNTQARIVPDPTATRGGITATNIYRIADQMSRVGTQVDAAFGTREFDPASYTAFVQLVGAYHSALAVEQPNLLPDVRAGAQRLEASDTWKRLNAVEDTLLSHGYWKSGVPAGLPVNRASWNALATSVSNSLTALARHQADLVSNQLLTTTNDQLLYSGLGSLLTIAVACVAIVLSLRQGRALVIRLAQLRDKSLALVDIQLPEMLDRLRRNERVDVDAELQKLDGFGSDEIGQVASAIDVAQRTAVAAAVQEAEAKGGTRDILVGIARRLQRPSRQLLELLKGMQGEEEEPARLQQLFGLDHQATQILRNLENLLILGDSALGRRWRKPVPLPDVLRAAAQETRDYTRVKVQVFEQERMQSVYLDKDAVSMIIHMLADLLDNAIAYSPPASSVVLRGQQVGVGRVAIEIEDQGVGMSDADIAAANDLLKEPPEVNARNLGDAFKLGFWVIARLARTLDVRVELRSSPYGGIQAIVLLPAKLLVDQPSEEDDGPPRPAPASAPRADTVEFARPEAPSWWDRPPAGTRPHARTPSPGPTVGRPPSAPAPEAGRRPQLPQRQPQHHLAPQLQTDRPHLPSSRDLDDPGSIEPPEQARDRWASFQRGTRRGRTTD